jgi:hypothetical protein
VNQRISLLITSGQVRRHPDRVWHGLAISRDLFRSSTSFKVNGTLTPFKRPSQEARSSRETPWRMPLNDPENRARKSAEPLDRTLRNHPIPGFVDLRSEVSFWESGMPKKGVPKNGPILGSILGPKKGSKKGPK